MEQFLVRAVAKSEPNNGWAACFQYPKNTEVFIFRDYYVFMLIGIITDRWILGVKKSDIKNVIRAVAGCAQKCRQRRWKLSVYEKSQSHLGFENGVVRLGSGEFE